MTEHADQIGASLVASGAEAAEIDPRELLAALKATQARVDALEAEKRADHAPDVVRVTDALHAHLSAKAAAHPHIHENPDSTFAPLLDAAASLAGHAKAAAEAGHPGEVPGALAAVEKLVARHARRHPSLDYSYVLDLIEEAQDAAEKIAG